MARPMQGPALQKKRYAARDAAPASSRKQFNQRAVAARLPFSRQGFSDIEGGKLGINTETSAVIQEAIEAIEAGIASRSKNGKR